MKTIVKLFVLSVLLVLAACGKSAEQRDREETERRSSMQKALAASIDEEREKDRRMREAAVAQADERIARDAAQDASESAAKAAAEQPQRALSEAMGRYVAKLRQSSLEPSSVQVRNVTLSPNANGMCAEFNGKDKTGAFTGFKRVVVTDTRVATEEAPMRESLTQFLLFQLAARDTGCFPDVHSVRILQ